MRSPSARVECEEHGPSAICQQTGETVGGPAGLRRLTVDHYGFHGEVIVDDGEAVVPFDDREATAPLETSEQRLIEGVLGDRVESGRVAYWLLRASYVVALSTS